MNEEYELSRKRVERNILKTEKPAEELWDDDEFQRLEQQIQKLERKVDGGSA